MMGWDTVFYLMIASYLITRALTPKPEQMQPASFDSLDFPQVDEGTPQAVIFGDVYSGDWTVLWYGDYGTSSIESSSGKK